MVPTKETTLDIIVRLFSLVYNGFFILTIVHHVKDTSALSVVDRPLLAFKTGGQKDFIYLVQAEGCLPSHLLHPHQLGRGDNRDVIVLSWKTECKHRSRDYPHIAYIHRNNTSWGTGRNILYRLARATNNNYLFYNFLDEDLEFAFTDGRRPKDSSSHSPLQLFETFLRVNQPAVGLTHFCSVCGKMLANGSYVPSMCCSRKPKDFLDVFPVSISFDAGFNAFHRDAVGHLLPYNLEYEDKSWWESQKFVILASDLMFRGQVQRYLPVKVTNTKHRKYPKAYLENWKHILDRLRDKAPENIRHLGVFKEDPIPDMAFNITNNVLFTPRWNVTIPGPKEPIVPYRHLQS